jgi:homoaconitase/3-isopropylmalate dehydratase large subunit
MPGADKKPKTLYDKVVDAHIVNEQEDGTILLYIGMRCFPPRFFYTLAMNTDLALQTDILSMK